MADVTITAANVLPYGIYHPATGKSSFGVELCPFVTATAGEAVTPGQPLRTATVSSVLTAYKAKNDSSDNSAIAGICANPAGTGQKVYIYTPLAVVRIGATLTMGTEYFLSGNAGGICLAAGVASGHYVVKIGGANGETVPAEMGARSDLITFLPGFYPVA